MAGVVDDVQGPTITDTGLPGARHGRRLWLLAEGGKAEVCRFDPGFGEDLVVTVDGPLVFARWRMGQVAWAAALRSGGVTVAGSRALGRALPTWNAGPDEHARRRAERDLPVGGPA